MRKLDLRTGKPVWLSYRTAKALEHPLEKDLATEVLVVGMGMSGAMTANLLTEPLGSLRRRIGAEKAIRA